MTFNEDEYRDKQLDKYLEEQEEDVSNCCGAPICDESSTCCDCREHCEPISKGEHEFDMREAYLEDKADADRDEARLEQMYD